MEGRACSVPPLCSKWQRAIAVWGWVCKHKQWEQKAVGTIAVASALYFSIAGDASLFGGVLHCCLPAYLLNYARSLRKKDDCFALLCSVRREHRDPAKCHLVRLSFLPLFWKIPVPAWRTGFQIFVLATRRTNISILLRSPRYYFSTLSDIGVRL